MKKAFIIGHYTSRRCLKKMEEDNKLTKDETKAHKLLEIIMEVDTVHSSKGRLMGYAQQYALAAITNEMQGKVLRVQLLYVLNNLAGWRGEEARKVKAQLKKLVKKL